MVRITYQTTSPITGIASVPVTDDFKSMEDFRIFACALFSGNWCVLKVENV